MTDGPSWWRDARKQWAERGRGSAGKTIALSEARTMVPVLPDPTPVVRKIGDVTIHTYDPPRVVKAKTPARPLPPPVRLMDVLNPDLVPVAVVARPFHLDTTGERTALVDAGIPGVRRVKFEDE